jgi:hypothetical protein
MAYRITYDVTVQWVGPGMGPMDGSMVPLRGSEVAGAQILGVFNISGGQNVAGSGTGGILQAADITLLLVGPAAAGGNVGTTAGGGMAIDISNQLNAAATLAILQGWASGNP